VSPHSADCGTVPSTFLNASDNQTLALMKERPTQLGKVRRRVRASIIVEGRPANK
jgi:hypothetical protein